MEVSSMPKRKGKSHSFDAMVKFFMNTYDIPTKKDVDKLITRLDRLERLIRATQPKHGRRKSGQNAKSSGMLAAVTASDEVLSIIKRFKQGAGFADIRENSGFGEKKLRNIIYRLNKTGKIKRINRGRYTAV
jgi:uncharacterized protein (DUF885 family)